ncbi:uncharacterized protein [Typha angustifolia]|uniref:uncharacterized protein n=1 Tax=Typha angustifolia TaxID=59011 RepID=UPI003C2B4163
MAQEEKSETLSLIDLPVSNPESTGDTASASAPGSDADDFEFRISVGGGLVANAADTDMCAADEVFFRGQLLPLRPSISSDSGLLRHGSRSESMDLSSRSGSSSSCVSRSHSSSSHSGSSASNNFYAFPSPSPQLRGSRRRSSARRNSTSSSAPPSWGLLRLGVVPAPEIELRDLRSRRSRGGKQTGGDGNGKVVEKRSPSLRFMGIGFGCNCSPDAVEPVRLPVASPPPPKKKEEPKRTLKKGENMGRRRIFEWLDELSIAKA